MNVRTHDDLDQPPVRENQDRFEFTVRVGAKMPLGLGAGLCMARNPGLL